MVKGSLLHVGCGGDPIPEWAQDKFNEVRFDISPDHNPDIVGCMVNMGSIGPFDAIHCSHALEHLMPYEVPVALKEFYRVLNPDGFAVVFVPDLEDVRATEEVLFNAPGGPITGLDLIYGLRKVLDQMPYMAHRTGFVSSTFEQAFRQAGFTRVTIKRLDNYNLMGIAAK